MIHAFCRFGVTDRCFFFLQIWRDRPLYYGLRQNWVGNWWEGYWGDVTYIDLDDPICVYLGKTTEEIISRMKTVLSFC